MTWSKSHISHLKNIGAVVTDEGISVEIFELDTAKIPAKIFSEWAKHFRNHYCSDSEIDQLRSGTSLSRAEYLEKFKFPSNDGFGPGIRSGDFAEILVADYLEFVLDHWVPRIRYSRKIVQDESTKGSDVVGFKILDSKESVKDILTIFESKAQFSGAKAKPRLQDAIDDSIKDELRKAESLNALKQRLIDQKETLAALKVERFQDPATKPYTERYGAAALFCETVYDATEIKKSLVSKHPHRKGLSLLVIKGADFMSFVHKLYQYAANEA
ncbi:Hachiman antiphage defense system protein HamA [Aurantibacillus circumpalustris]|uniref:Hachiman antiphage defense system protein HamA n=1 Tax=Aurantibacillus circumpalustris TaxID=3036359 RepID=UPI00295BB70D|nr:Hachiman antiphage defense system protein HamA [Aurantibacillus circumpalustris]